MTPEEFSPTDEEIIAYLRQRRGNAYLAAAVLLIEELREKLLVEKTKVSLLWPVATRDSTQTP